MWPPTLRRNAAAPLLLLLLALASAPAARGQRVAAYLVGCQAYEGGGRLVVNASAPPGCTRCDTRKGYALVRGRCECAANFGSYRSAPCAPGKGGKPDPKCARFPTQQPSEAFPSLAVARKNGYQCLPCPTGMTSAGGMISRAVCEQNATVSGRVLAADIQKALLVGSALANPTPDAPAPPEPRCVVVRVPRDAPMTESFAGYTCTWDGPKPRCNPNQEELGAQFPDTGCAPQLLPLMSAIEASSCKEVLRYPYQGEQYSCAVTKTGYSFWGTDATVMCCVHPPGGASGCAAIGPECKGDTVTTAESTIVVDPQDLTEVPEPLRGAPWPLAASAAFVRPALLDLAPVNVTLDFQSELGTPAQVIAELKLDPGRFANVNVTPTNPGIQSQWEQAATQQQMCQNMPDLPRVYPPPKPEDWCAQWLAQLTKASADADAEHARATATWRERSAYWAMQHPLLTNDYARPAIGGGKRPKLALSWAFPASAQLGASGARWAPSKSGYAFSAHEAFELAAVADLILTAAEESGFDPGHDVLISSTKPVRIMYSDSRPDSRRLSKLESERLRALDRKADVIRKIFGTTSNRVERFISRCKKMYSRSMFVLGLFTNLDKLVDLLNRIKLGIISKVVKFVRRVLNVSNDTAEKIVKTTGKILNYAYKFENLRHKGRLQLKVIEAQIMAGHALICTKTNLLSATKYTGNTKEVEAAMLKMDDLAASDHYMHSLELSEKLVDAYIDAVEALHELLYLDDPAEGAALKAEIETLMAGVGEPAANGTLGGAPGGNGTYYRAQGQPTGLSLELVIQPLESVMDGMAAVLQPLNTYVAEPLVAVMEYELCINLLVWKGCISLQSILEGISTVISWALGWAEDIINKILEPVWNMLDGLVQSLFDMLVPHLPEGWDWLPMIPTFVNVNADALVFELRRNLEGFKDTEWLPMMVRQRVVPIGRTGNERWPSTTFLRIKDNVIEGAAPADAGNYCSFYKPDGSCFVECKRFNCIGPRDLAWVVPSSPQGNFVTAFPSGWLEADKKTLKADHILRLDCGSTTAKNQYMAFCPQIIKEVLKIVIPDACKEFIPQ